MAKKILLDKHLHQQKVKEKKIALKIHRLKLAIIKLTDVDLEILDRLVQEEKKIRQSRDNSTDNN